VAVPGRVRTLRVALVLGFCLTVALWLFASLQFARRVVSLREDATRINAQYSEIQESLNVAWRQILLASILARDAVLNTASPDANMGRRIATAYQRADNALTRYPSLAFSPADAARITQMRGELAALRATMTVVLDQTRAGTAEGARALLAQARLRRELIDTLTENLEQLNRRGFEEQQHQIAALYRGTRRLAWALLVSALALSLVIGVCTVWYTARLERQLKADEVRDAQHAEDLRRLSARLIHAQEEERRVIARELHDEVGQILTAIKVELAMAARAVDAAGAPATLLRDVRAIADEALSTVRNLSQLLHPGVLDDLGLQPAVEWQAHELQRRFGVHVQVASNLDARLSRQVERAGYRVIQEALTNVAKHARTASCQVALHRTAGQLVIVVEDAGVGFAVDSPEDPRRGLGFVGMRERAAELGGTLEIHSRPGQGTRITMTLPLTEIVETSETAGAVRSVA
jgi:signal transduction histidine kinase